MDRNNLSIIGITDYELKTLLADAGMHDAPKLVNALNAYWRRGGSIDRLLRQDETTQKSGAEITRHNLSRSLKTRVRKQDACFRLLSANKTRPVCGVAQNTHGVPLSEI